MAKDKPKARLEKYQKNHILRTLSLRSLDHIPRCPAKNSRFVVKREEEDDFTHSVVSHRCEECSCKNAAGHGTKGDFWGVGDNTGHYGVGWCAAHERGRSQVGCLRFARSHMKAIRTTQATEVPEEYALVTKDKAELAERKNEVREGLESLLTTLMDIKDKYERTPQKENDIVVALNRLSDTIEDSKESETIDVSQANELIELVKVIIYGEQYLTEAVNGRVIPATGVKRIQALTQLTNAIGSLTKVDFQVSKKEFIHIDVILPRIRQMITLKDRFVQPNMQSDFVTELARIWRSVERTSVNDPV